MSSHAKPAGIYTILPLPFTETYEINQEELLKAIDWAVGAGAKGIIATGSVGEFSHLTEAERRLVMEISLDRIRKHKGIQAVAMTAAAGTLETIAWTKYAKELGYDSVLIVPPYYWRVGEDEVFRHFQMITEAVDIPVIVYHNPITSKFSISVPFAQRLAALPGIVGMKEMGHDMAFLMSLYEAVGGKLGVLQTFRVYLIGLMLGASGGAITSFGLPACVRISELFAQGDLLGAMKIQQALNKLFKGSTEGSGVLGRIKTACSLVAGLNFGPPRPPYLAPNEKELAILKTNFDNLAAAMDSVK
jgi:dihydrodipicolinate synthase/N-acetylneuraminate lyase